MNNTYIKSPINYIGNKYRLIKQIIELFPKHISYFVDVFGGSGTVLINTKANHYLYNDVNPYLCGIFDGLINTEYKEIVEKIESLISEYKLSKTNKDGFKKLRDAYNNGKNDWITLYTLMCHSFNHQFRFNNNHQYNSSFGKNRAYFSDRQKNDLLEMKNRIETTEILILSKTFMNLDYSDYDANDLLYFDPPYYNSVGNYNDGKRGFEGWTIEHEKELLSLLDILDSQGTRFALSNNLKYDNPILCEWKGKYNIHDLGSKDCEVLITNY